MYEPLNQDRRARRDVAGAVALLVLLVVVAWVAVVVFHTEGWAP